MYLFFYYSDSFVDDQAIRIGDAYAILIEHHFKAGNPDVAFRLVQDMSQRQIALHPYLERDLLDQIHAAVGKENSFDPQKGKPDPDEDMVKEELGQVESTTKYRSSSPNTGIHK